LAGIAGGMISLWMGIGRRKIHSGPVVARAEFTIQQIEELIIPAIYRKLRWI
jgi:hypothetical protein